MERLPYFDCSCSFGRRGVVNPGSFYTVEDLMRNMEHYGIKKALVYHAMAREYNPVVGNSMLMESIKEYDNLYPVWIVMPHHTDEFPKPTEMIKQLQHHNVKIVRMFPGVGDQNYSIADWNCGELLSILEKYRIPLMIGIDQIGWNELHHLCMQYPELSVILTEVNYRVDRNLYPLLKKLPNLYIETMGYKVHNGIEEICERFGANRFIFGSSMPVFSGAAAVSMINYARISQEEKYMIAYKNLEDLVKGVRL